ncbi:YcxB family protein [Bordetella avium]|uniref:YcxB family protein n=1 Tax=Bordetella avium TaxID=521 RepID=UPI00307D6390
MSADKTVSLQVDLTLQDYEDFVSYAHRRAPLTRRRLRGHLRFAATILVGLLLLAVARTRDAEGHMDWAAAMPTFLEWAVVAIVVLALLSLSFERLIPALGRSNVRRALKQAPENPFLGRHRLDFSAEGVRDTGERETGSLPWDLVRDAEETEEYLFLFIAPLQGVIIPKRGQREEDLQAVRAVMRTYVPNAGLSS